MKSRIRLACVLSLGLPSACAGTLAAPNARPPGSNVEVEVLFDGSAHLVTTVVTHDTGEAQAEPSHSRRRVLYLTLAEGRPEHVLVSQVFESLLNVPTSGSQGVTGALTVSDSCYSASEFQVAPGAEVKLRQRVHADAHCELQCFVKQSDHWHSMPCLP